MKTITMTSREFYNFEEENRSNNVNISNVGDDGRRKIYHVFFRNTYEWLEIIVRDQGLTNKPKDDTIKV